MFLVGDEEISFVFPQYKYISFYRFLSFLIEEKISKNGMNGNVKRIISIIACDNFSNSWNNRALAAISYSPRLISIPSFNFNLEV